MDSPRVSVGTDLRNQMADIFAPKHVEVPQPNTGFAALDAMKEGAAEISEPNEPQESAQPAPRAPKAAPDDGRMAKIVAQAQKVQADRQALAQEKAEHAADMAELARMRALRAISKEDPVAWAEEGGYKPDEYATTLMEKGSLNPERRRLLEQQKEISELKSWKQQQVEQQAAQQQSHYKNAAQQEMVAALDTFGDTYDLVKRTKSYDRVLDKITEHYRANIEAVDNPSDAILPYEEAFAAVERELEEYYSPVLESPKFRSKLATESVTQGPGAALTQPAARKSPGTINSKFKAQSSAPRPLSENERLAKAGEFFLNQTYGRR